MSPQVRPAPAFHPLASVTSLIQNERQVKMGVARWVGLTGVRPSASLPLRLRLASSSELMSEASPNKSFAVATKREEVKNEPTTSSECNKLQTFVATLNNSLLLATNHYKQQQRH